MATNDPQILTHLSTLVSSQLPNSPIYNFLLGSPDNNNKPIIRLTHASPGLFLARLTLGPQHVNSRGGIHGGVSATIVDWAGGMSIATWDLREKTGVSAEIHVRYMSSAKVGDEVEIQGTAEKVGGSLAFTKVEIWKVVQGEEEEEGKEERRGAMVVSGTHTKFVQQRK